MVSTGAAGCETMCTHVTGDPIVMTFLVEKGQLFVPGRPEGLNEISSVGIHQYDLVKREGAKAKWVNS